MDTKTIYVIFDYQENDFGKPQVFTSESQARQKVREMYENEPWREYEECDGEFSEWGYEKISEDRIVQLQKFEVKPTDKLFFLVSMEYDKDFLMNANLYATAEALNARYGEVSQELRDKYVGLTDKLFNEDENDPSFPPYEHSTWAIRKDGWKAQSETYYTEYGNHGSCYNNLMKCIVPNVKFPDPDKMGQEEFIAKVLDHFCFGGNGIIALTQPIEVEFRGYNEEYQCPETQREETSKMCIHGSNFTFMLEHGEIVSDDIEDYTPIWKEIQATNKRARRIRISIKWDLPHWLDLPSSMNTSKVKEYLEQRFGCKVKEWDIDDTALMPEK